MSLLQPSALMDLAAAGLQCEQQGELNAAAAHFEEVLRQTARKLGEIRAGQNYWNLALPYLEIAARNESDHEVQFLLARAYRLHLRLEDAVTPLQRALRGMSVEGRQRWLSRPETIEMMSAICGHLGNRLGRHMECVEIYRLALEAAPENPAILNNLAVSFSFVNLFGESAAILRRLIDLDENNFLARCNLATCLVRMGNLDAAILEFEECERRGYAGHEALGGLLEQKSLACDWEGMKVLRQKVADALDDPARNQRLALTTLQVHFDDPGRLKRWTQQISALAYELDSITPLDKPAGIRRDGRIRIGYYSPHFYDNPVAHLTASLFALHDREEFEVFVYAYGPNDGHPVRGRIAAEAEHFRSLEHASPLQLAQQIRADEIDILVDLSANLGWSKPATLTYRPAPVQVNWLGFIGTMGVPVYDYVIADRFVAPDGADADYSEKLVRLPDTFQITDFRRPVPVKSGSRIQHGLPEDAFVFLNCGLLFKIQPEMFQIWVRILHQVPNAVLWLLAAHPSAERNLRAQWQKEGLDQGRLIFAPRVPMPEHINRIAHADLFIDTYPCGSGATANDVLWAGVPLLGLVGKTMVSRMAGSLLNAVGLPELVARDSREYEEKAIFYATHPVELQKLRQRVAANKSTWPLFDTPRFVRNLESSYRQMAVRARAGQSPIAIDVAKESR